LRRAISYARFSHQSQADGHSLARQLEAAENYCRRNNLTLDERTYKDEGVSGFDGSNARGGDLAEFIDLAKSGKVPAGSVLVVENIDRLSRLPPDEATNLIMGIVKAGVEVATLSPEQRYTRDNIHTVGVWVPLQVAICLAREESVKKSSRLKDAWQRKRAALAQGAAVKLTKKGPFWLKLSEDRATWIVLESEAELMRRMFRWSADGLGVAKICERLHAERPEGITGRGWQPQNVNKLLRSRAALGELQPRTGTCAKKGGIPDTRKPAGAAVAGYFPAIINEADYFRAQAALDGRRRGGGRVSGTPNLFNGFLHDARDGRRMVLNASGIGKVLVSSGALRKMPGSVFAVVPYRVAEYAILGKLRELKVKDVAGDSGPTDDVDAWETRLKAVNAKIAQTSKRAAAADDPSVFLGLLDEYGTQRKAIQSGLDAAKAAAASPPREVLAETGELIDQLDGARGAVRDELRAKVRAGLRRLIAEAYLLVVPRDRNRIFAVQLQFSRGGSRAYLIDYRPGEVLDRDWLKRRVISTADLTGLAREFDLRDPKHVRELERVLSVVPLDEPDAGPAKPVRRRRKR
jgi:DNA invertase Pin-like site-specific DNA recombinase